MAVDGEAVVERFSGVQVYFHALFASSIFVLLLTGLPITFHSKLAWMLALIGYGNVVFVHIVAAVALILSSLYYALFVATGLVMGQTSLPSLPGRRDVDDAIQHVRYIAGRGEEPAAEKYTFLQKAEIWILVFEVVVLTVTGIFLWFRGLLVGQGASLLLFRDVHAVVALTMLMGITFHLYTTHLADREIDWTMITGTVSRDRARQEWADWVDASSQDGRAADGGQQSAAPTEVESATLLSRGTTAGLVILLAAIYTGVLLQTVLAPLPSGESITGWLTGGVPGGVIGWAWTIALNFVVFLLLGSFVALLYGMARRF